ncbi:MAG: alkaline phosphatase [Bacteroidetes bacterium]|nr:alkaline phosphatase [Bacteroidota bacterium]
MHKMFIFLLLFCTVKVFSQPAYYNTSNAHSHNDYEQSSPFRLAYDQQFGSIEADVFLQDDKLMVAHHRNQITAGKTLEALYLDPLNKSIEKNNGFVYSDKNLTLQLLVDLKTKAVPTLIKLIEILKRYPALTAATSLKIVISGNRPPAESFKNYPAYIYFDGELSASYPEDALPKIEMLSDNFKKFSLWNGMGNLPEADLNKVVTAIKKGHDLKKKVRFWNAPDIVNAWYEYMNLGVDYINTDHIDAMGNFLRQLANRSYTSPTSYTLYTPRYRNDGTAKPVKNVILLIGDGTGLAQWYAGYTANGGALNVFNMKYTGLSKTSSYDSYITDSAPGSTAFSSGVKTNNRAVGVDHTGKALTLLPDIFFRHNIPTGIIASCDITDATPADFYAHQSERDSSAAILNDLLTAHVDIIMGEKPDLKNIEDINHKLAKKFTIVNSVQEVESTTKMPLMVADKKAGLTILKGRGNWSVDAFEKAIALLSKNNNGFFLMQEGSQIDDGGHDNKLPIVATEVMDFDQVIGKAMEFADSNGETLVIVIADHETGGLTLTSGVIKKRYVSGHFSTSDHTAIPVPVFAYGPGSQLFSGVYENTEVFQKILKAMNISQ